MCPMELKPDVIGERLRLARGEAGLTQGEAAAEISAARTTLIAIEKGQRRIRTAELQKLANLYNTTANSILRNEAVHIDLVPRFRKQIQKDNAASQEATQSLSDLVKAEVELEEILGIKRVRNYPPERPLLAGDVRIQAENDALELRHWLGLGIAPIPDLTTLLELDLGIRIFIWPIDSKISGLFAYDEAVGACMLLNARHPRERRNQSGAHELGHFVSSRGTPEILRNHETVNSRAERYANVFGRAFLTPARAVLSKFNEITAGSSHLSRRHVIVLAHTFGVSREAMVRRLEELELTKQGSWEWFKVNGGITNHQARQVLGERISSDVDRFSSGQPTSLRIGLLAAEAWVQELMSEGQLADLLHLGYISLRELLDAFTNVDNEEDGSPELQH